MTWARIVAIAVLAATGARPEKSEATVIYAAQEAESLALGRDRALQDRVRMLRFDSLTGPANSVDGTATPFGAWYTIISRHWLPYVPGVLGMENFSISIWTGTSTSNVFQRILISRIIDIDPTKDLLILEHSLPVANAFLPEFGDLSRNDIVEGIGFGRRRLFEQTTFVHDGLPAYFNSRVFSTTDPSRVGLDPFGASPIPGGPQNFDSSAPIYKNGKLTMMIQGGIESAGTSFGLSFDPVLRSQILGATPLNTVPEPSTLAFGILGALTLGFARRRPPRSFARSLPNSVW